MIDINQILEWKQTYGDIYQIEILGQHFIFRALGREEYKDIILMNLELGEFQEVICFQSVIYPTDFNYSVGIAGVAEILSDGILDISGLHMGQGKEILDEYRAEMFNYDYQVDALIHEAFPEFRLEEISTWSVRKTMFYLSRAEWILRNLKGVQIETIDENTMEQYAQQQLPQQRMVSQQHIPPEFQEQFDQMGPPEITAGEQFTNNFLGGEQSEPQPKDAPESGIQSEEELLAMLSGSGAKVSKPITNLDDEVKPELKWFGYMDELKGEFD